MKKLWLWIFAACASVAVIFAGTPALAVDLRPEDGFDVSYPQCGRTLPTPGAFSIIGVDDGRAFAARDESCLENQLTWAKQGGREIQLYANTGNPGGPWIWDTTVSPRQQLAISNWPSRVSGTNSTKPYPCTSSSPDTYYCAYDYGYRAAYESFQRAKAAFAAAGVGYSPASVNWWLDIEWGIVDGVTEGNTWRGHDDGYIHPNDSKMTMAQKNGRNLWALKGMHDYFVSTARVKQLGFYSSPTAWNTIAASNTRAFADHPFWYPIGPATNEEAVAKCEAWVLNVTGAGQPAMVQYVDTDLNLDMSVRCDPQSVISYRGVRTVTHGAKFTLTAKLMSATSDVALHGQRVQFSYRGQNYVTRTDQYGYARVKGMVAPTTPGTVAVTVSYATNSYLSSSQSVSITVQ